MKFKHNLGVKAKDQITGFTGIITGRTEFLTGCNRYCLQPQGLEKKIPIDPLWFDEDQITIVGAGISPKKVTGKKRGACSPDPVK